MNISNLSLRENEKEILFSILNKDIQYPSEDIEENLKVARIHGIEGEYLETLTNSNRETRNNYLPKYREYLAKQTLYYHTRLKVLKELYSFDSSLIVMKGFAISLKCYTEKLNRAYSDIDILVPEDRFAMLDKKLIASGFQYSAGWNTEKLVKQCAYVKKIGLIKIELDIHTQLSADFEVNNILYYDIFLANSELVTINDIEIRIPSLNILLLHSIIHFLSHVQKGNLIKLLWVYDLILLLTLIDRNSTTPHLIKFIKEKECYYLYLHIIKTLTNNISKLDFYIPKIESQKSETFTLKHLVEERSGFYFFINNIKHSKNLKQAFHFIFYSCFPPINVIQKKYPDRVIKDYQLPYYYLVRLIKAFNRYKKPQYEIKS